MKHLEKAGSRATVTESADLAAIKDRRGIPGEARSCHTGVVTATRIEGHVPAADISGSSVSGRRSLALRFRACPPVHEAWRSRAAVSSPMTWSPSTRP